MMKGGISFNQRDIIFVPFPFSDLSGDKKRPVLILSGKEYNKNNNNYICCALTSKIQNFKRGVKIDSSNLDEGNLTYDSAIIPCQLFNANKIIAIKKIARLNKEKSIEVVKFLNLSIDIE